MRIGANEAGDITATKSRIVYSQIVF